MGEMGVVHSVPELAGVSSQHTPPCLQARCPLKMMMTSLSTPCILWRTTRTLKFHGMVMLRLRAGTSEVQVVPDRAHPTADLLLIWIPLIPTIPGDLTTADPRSLLPTTG